MTRQELLDTLNHRELVATVADRLITNLQEEADNNGEEFDDYDIDSFADTLDDFMMDVQNAIEHQLP